MSTPEEQSPAGLVTRMLSRIKPPGWFIGWVPFIKFDIQFQRAYLDVQTSKLHAPEATFSVQLECCADCIIS